jgi:predicted TIM-barrel fold metal-dependent hydrolase
MRPTRRPTRRTVLATGLGAGAGALLAAAPRPRAAAAAPPVVDIHCHMFNGADLPITGFLAHFVPGLSDVSRELTTVPEAIVRRIIGFIHQEIINRVAPDKAAELAYLDGLKAANKTATPVGFLTDPTLLARYNQGVNAAAGQLAALPLLGLDPAKVSAALDRVARLLFLVSHERSRIAATMATTYPEVSLFTPLLVDYDAWSNDKPAVPLIDQIDVHAEVARASMADRIGRAGARFHPFVAFDPLREVRAHALTIGTRDYKPYGDARAYAGAAKYQCPTGAPPVRPPATAGAIALARHAIESAGFIGCKLYPPVGFAAADNEHLNADAELGKKLDVALQAFFAYCEAEEVPITAHTSAGNEYGLGFRDFVSPARWEPALRKFPRLRLNLGHFGHDEGIDAKEGVKACGAWIRQAASLIAVYPNVYADMSNSPLVYDEVYAKSFLGYLEEIFRKFPAVQKRVMYGSDFWLNRLDPGADDFVKQFTTKLMAKFGPAVTTDIMGTNALRFLGLLDDQGRKPAANRNRARLRRFYGAVPQPAWLAD